MWLIGHYRLIWPADAVRAVRPDWEIRVYDPRMVKVDRVTGEVHGMDLDGLDLLVTQRVGLDSVARLCRTVRRRGAAIAMDADDAMWCLDPANTAYRSWNSPGRGAAGTGLHWSVTDRVASFADLVTVTTDALAARYGEHGRVRVLPNRIPRMALSRIRRVSRDAPVAGWAGLLDTHPHDPKVVGDALRRAAELVEPGVIGDGYRTGKMWGVKVTQFRTASLGMDYYRQLSRFDIGLVPLDLAGSSAEFNAGKSSLKALEYAATGSAVIASPSPANQLLAEEIPIRLAGSPDEWFEHMAVLADPVVRAEQVAKQRAAVEAGWVLQDRAEDWADAWAAAVENRRNEA